VRSTRNLLVVASSVVIAASLAACSGAASASPSAPNGTAKADAVETVTLKVGGSFGPTGGAFDIAEYEGFFAKNGLEIEAQTYNGGPPAVQALLAGRADIANFAPSTSVETWQTKDPLVGVAYTAAGGGQYPIVSKKFLRSHGVDPDTYAGLPVEQRIAALKGTVWGTHATGGLWDHYVDIIVAAAGLTPKDVSLVALGNNDADEASFKSGRVNAIIVDKVTAEEYTKDHDAVVVFDPTDPAIQKQFAAVELSGTGFITTRSWAEENGETLGKFLTALLQASDWIKTHTAQEQADVVAEHNPDTAKETILGYIEESADAQLYDLRLPKTSIDGNLALAIASGAIPATPRPDDTFIFDPKYLDAVGTPSR
jgi:NitT/TauT family transport system substrate-binding protein